MALGVFKKLVRGLSRTRESLATTLQEVVAAPEVNEDALDDLEASLLAADLGPELTDEVIQAVRRGVGGGSRGEGLSGAVRSALRGALPDDGVGVPVERGLPHVVFVVGVNGGGKTTTVGKLAHKEREAGRKAIVVAADTFRAAAIDQLERWTERAGVDLIKHRDGADPAAVVFDALKAARARGVDTVLVRNFSDLIGEGDVHVSIRVLHQLADLGRHDIGFDEICLDETRVEMYRGCC